jgi:hypothetical protein
MTPPREPSPARIRAVVEARHFSIFGYEIGSFYDDHLPKLRKTYGNDQEADIQKQAAESRAREFILMLDAATGPVPL